MIRPSTVVLFCNLEQVTEEVKAHLQKYNVQIQPYTDFVQFLKGIQQNNIFTCESCSHAIASSRSDIQLFKIEAKTPICLLKSVKNEKEVQGLIDCHKRDGAAICDYLAWLEKSYSEGKTLNEYEGSQVSESMRKKQKNFVFLSFETISASGPNSAIIHYQATKDQFSVIAKDQVYMLDSGGQYLDGTTDTTRTIYIQCDQSPSEEMKDRYTRVLLGNLDIERQRWNPKDDRISNKLDFFARRRLWEISQDYGHGTGHGIGFCLGVHELPPRISGHDHKQLFKANQFMSNEPGFYKEGAFGIRIENELLVQQDPLSKTEFSMYFKNLTCAPYERKLFDFSLLSPADIQYINQYHQKVYQDLKELVLPETLEWLQKNTAPLN